MLAPLDRETGREDPSSDKPRLAMHPSCEYIIIYQGQFEPPYYEPAEDETQGLVEAEPDDTTLQLTLYEAALRFNLPTCLPPVADPLTGEILPGDELKKGCILEPDIDPEAEPERPLW